MNIITVSAEAHLAQIASCIGRFPDIWHNWKALKITCDAGEYDIESDLLHAAKVITESYLIGIEGRSYCCKNSIHILCKDVPVQIIEQTGSQICSLLKNENNYPVNFKTFNLETDHEEYARAADQDSSNIYLHSSTNRFLDRNKANHFDLPDNKKSENIKSMTRVLLVEDDPVTRWMVRNALKNVCEFACAPTANRAFSMYSTFNPELVFLDINLPDNNGHNVLQWIMKNDPGAFVVMFSSQNNLNNILESIEKGARGFIGKPFLQEQLFNYIHQA